MVKLEAEDALTWHGKVSAEQIEIHNLLMTRYALKYANGSCLCKRGRRKDIKY
jgi:hypothetical protein